jgi:NAD(P)H dehydrogenase (quinone)
MSIAAPILVTGAAGRVGGVGREVVEILRRRDLPVRALVRSEDERAGALRAIGAEVVVGDLTRAGDVARALEGCRRMYFGMSVSAPYLEATVTTAAVARERGDLEVLVNISQLTVSEMSLTASTDSPQQRQHWLGEQVLNWSGLPVVHVRATVFLQHPFFSPWAAESIARDGTIRLPFGEGRTSPVDTQDVAEVIAAILSGPAGHVGKVYELTGPRSEDMRAVAAEFSEALGRTITYDTAGEFPPVK